MSDYVRCSRCGKQVSNLLPVEVIVRAYVECPECIEKRPEQAEPNPDARTIDLREVIGYRYTPTDGKPMVFSPADVEVVLVGPRDPVTVNEHTFGDPYPRPIYPGDPAERRDCTDVDCTHWQFRWPGGAWLDAAPPRATSNAGNPA